MYASKILMEAFPNIHLLGVFTVSLTVIYRKKALYPIYTYVFLNGLMSGFSIWWIPYLYIWTVLWGAVMLVPVNYSSLMKTILYMLLCTLHGFLFGVLYAPAQALFFGLDWNEMLAWIVAGLPFDIIHGISNFFCSFLIQPFVSTIRLAEKSIK